MSRTRSGLRRSISHTAALTAFAASIALTASCSTPNGPTAIVVVVDTSIAIPRRISTIRIDVTDPQHMMHTNSTTLTMPGTTLPVTYQVNSTGQPYGPVTVHVAALQNTTVVLERTVTTQFRPGHTTMLALPLIDQCVGVMCGDALLGCTLGPSGMGYQCENNEIDGNSLPDWTGNPPRIPNGSSCMSTAETCNQIDDDCDGMVDDGIDFMTDPANCGSCAHACSVENGTPVCRAGVCAIGTCNALRGNCDAMDANGCEQSLETLDHCGACGTTCSFANASASCGGGTCALGMCDPAFSDCDMSAANGCEADLSMSTTNCGRCGHACAAGTTCVNGTCSDMQLLGLDVGTAHACAIRPDGTLVCWGRNGSGQVNPANSTSSPTPVPVALPMPPRQVVTGDAHTCALLADGSVFCFGDNTYAQMGNGRVGPRDTNRIVFPMTVDYLVSGWNSLCAGRRGTDTLYCWGANTAGQLGDGFATDLIVATPITSLTGLTKLSMGRNHSCAILAGGNVSCWGRNDAGQLGDGTMTDHLSPTPVMGLGGMAIDIATGESHTCAVLSTGAVRCWGSNASGQIGDGTMTSVSTPTAVAGITDATSVVAASASTCVARRTGVVSCWGANSAGQLADGTTTSHASPAPAMGLVFPAVMAGRRESLCATVFEGAVKCWGRNSDGQLGDGTTMNRSSPVNVMGLP